MAAHISALTHNRPYQGCPNSTLLAASTSPCEGKYIDMYVGFMVTWMLSKWTHIAGVGLVSLPDAKVSDASRKLKSSGTNGRGMGHMGRIASRSRSAVTPTTATAKPCLLPNRPNARSMRVKYLEPRRGQRHATPHATKVHPT